MSYVAFVTTIGLRELSQDASEMVRRVEAGEQIGITVSGRLAAQLVPVPRPHWLRWAEIADIFGGRPDPDWERERAIVDQEVIDP